jgi:c-di-GMP-binding flagellar brake protein YcgR
MSQINDANDFRPANSDKEIQKILTELSTLRIVVAGFTQDQQHYVFNVKSINGDVLNLEVLAPMGRVLVAGDPLQMLFGLGDGQYLVRTQVAGNDGKLISVPLGREVFRLQRRNNFRTVVPANYKISLRVTSYKATPVKGSVALVPVNMSAGGLRAKWTEGLPSPQVGDSFSGVLVLLAGKQVEVFCTVKTIFGEKKAIEAGIEFQNLSVRDEQVLLFACLQIQRELFSLGR